MPAFIRISTVSGYVCTISMMLISFVIAMIDLLYRESELTVKGNPLLASDYITRF